MTGVSAAFGTLGPTPECGDITSGASSSSAAGSTWICFPEDQVLPSHSEPRRAICTAKSSGEGRGHICDMEMVWHGRHCHTLSGHIECRMR